MLKSVPELVANAKASVATLSAADAAKRITNENDTLLLDVRETEEHKAGSIEGAVNIPRGILEIKISGLAAQPDNPIIIHCAAGGRAVLAAKSLGEMGYNNVVAVTAGFEDLRRAIADLG